jgi:hypothetical protein
MQAPAKQVQPAAQPAAAVQPLGTSQRPALQTAVGPRNEQPSSLPQSSGGQQVASRHCQSDGQGVAALQLVGTHRFWSHRSLLRHSLSVWQSGAAWQIPSRQMAPSAQSSPVSQGR